MQVPSETRHQIPPRVTSIQVVVSLVKLVLGLNLGVLKDQYMLLNTEPPIFIYCYQVTHPPIKIQSWEFCLGWSAQRPRHLDA